MAAALNGARQKSVTATSWVLVIGGLAALYIPTFYDAARTLWRMDEHAHGPIVLAVIVWLFWDKRQIFLSAPEKPRPITGVTLFLLGLVLYVIGRSQNVAVFEFAAVTPILAGIVLSILGCNALRALWFPLLFVTFLVPLPGTVLDALTVPLKEQVSTAAEHVLYFAGYPVAREGVVISVGPYQLLVADACSGLQSLFTLAALGLLVMYLMARKSVLHNGIMLASIIPIAFCANLLRVVILILITYHFGDNAGQGFLHYAAGIVMSMISLAGVLGLDSALARAIQSPARS